MTPHHRIIGFTLIELVLSIVVIAVGIVGTMSLMRTISRHDADPVAQVQAIAIAEAYMEEISLKAFVDPDGSDVGETRSTFDDVNDYNGLNDNTGARDQGDSSNPNGRLIPGLGDYAITVSVIPFDLNGIGTANGRKITVHVTRGNVVDITLIGYRANHN